MLDPLSTDHNNEVCHVLSNPLRRTPIVPTLINKNTTNTLPDLNGAALCFTTSTIPFAASFQLSLCCRWTQA